MNPEFQRNVWLELTPLRVIVLVAVLALAFFAAALADGTVAGPGSVARWGFYIIVVIWGTRNAARSVVGEIRDRTWDGQRLSSLGAGTMLWGKLFGSTIFNWFGGAICLAVIAAETFDQSGPVTALIHLVYYVALGLITQSVSFLASLIAAGRRQGRTQFEVFLYQAAGLLAGIAVWNIADPVGSLNGSLLRPDTIRWWGQVFDAHAFLLVSLAIFTAWTLMGCYRQMRLELKLRNGPLVWLVFIAFMAGYVAGFDAWTPSDATSDPLSHRLFLAAVTCGAMAYVMVFLEPKNRVHFRWLGSAFGKFHVASALAHLQCWMMSYLVAMLIGIALLVRLSTVSTIGFTPGQAEVGAMLGFLTRDMAIIVLLNMVARRRGGDLLSIAVLVLLYGLMPAILSGLHYAMGQALFLPRLTDPLWLSPAAAWAEAVVLWIVAVAKIALPENRTA